MFFKNLILLQIGESRDFVEWLNDLYPIAASSNENQNTKNKNKNNDDILHALQLANDKHVITSKFIFDSIEAGRILGRKIYE